MVHLVLTNLPKNHSMTLPQRLFLSSILLFSYSGYSQYTDIINSNRPGRSMAAFSVGETVFQTEFGVYGFKEKHDLLLTETKGFGSEINLRYGAFLEQLEFNLDIDYRSDKIDYGNYERSRSGFRKTTLGAKYLFYDPYKSRLNEKPNLYSWKANNSFSWKRLIPAVGFYAGASINMGNNKFGSATDPTIAPKLAVIAQSQFGKNVFVANIISEQVSSDDPIWSYIVTLTHGFSEQWSGFIENQGIKSDKHSDLIFRGGAAYLLAENFQIDASFGMSAKNTPSLGIASIGFSWRFDENYMPSLIPIDDGKKEATEKKEKNDKKRKDEVLPE